MPRAWLRVLSQLTSIASESKVGKTTSRSVGAFAEGKFDIEIANTSMAQETLLH